MKKNVLAVMLLAAALALVGCGSGGGEDFDPNKIAVKQEGSGPPPMAPPGAPAGK